ncbi:MAG: hypothetical protein FJX23_06760 [Alphaproteobacteria bacterium]|nr:hypothetical protein [Alphaproteobacteria bacterium]
MHIRPQPPLGEGKQHPKQGAVWDLLRAIQGRDEDGVVDALHRGADVNFNNFEVSRMSPLHFAVNSGSPNIVATLLRWGADPNAETIRGYTPLHAAVEQNRPQMSTLLLDYGANPDHRAKSGTMELGDTILHDVVKSQNTDGTIQLLIAGADAHVVNKDGKTPLGAVSGIGSFSSFTPSILSALEMSEGLPRIPQDGALTKSSLFAPDEKGKCALDNPANWRRLPEMLSRLKEAGETPFTKAELMQEGANGMTYLERAANARALDVLVADFNSRGESFTVQEITSVKGLASLKGSAHLARAVFTPENTADWTPSKLRTDYALLNESAREAVTDFAQLTLRVGRNAPSRTGIGR